MTPTDLKDASDPSWKAERKPDPTLADLAHKAAARRFHRAAVAMETWQGPRDNNNPTYAKVVQEWIEAGQAHNAAGRALPREEG